MEIGTNDRLNFLNFIIIIDNNLIIFDRFQKQTCSGKFLNFYSHHPLCQKRGVIIGAVDRVVILLSHPSFQEKSFIDIINTFIENGYPLQFIFFTINNRLNYHNNNSTQFLTYLIKI